MKRVFIIWAVYLVYLLDRQSLIPSVTNIPFLMSDLGLPIALYLTGFGIGALVISISMTILSMMDDVQYNTIELISIVSSYTIILVFWDSLDQTSLLGIGNIIPFMLGGLTVLPTVNAFNNWALRTMERDEDNKLLRFLFNEESIKNPF